MRPKVTVAIVLGVIMFAYLMFYSTEAKVNEFTVNETINNQTQEITKLHYGRNDIVPVTKFGENTPSRHLKWENVLLLMAIYGIGMAILLKGKTDFGDIVPVDVHQQFIHDRLASKKNVVNFHVYENAPVVKENVDDKGGVPRTRPIIAEVEFDDSSEGEAGWKILAYVMDIRKKDSILDIMELREIPDNMIKCPNCGQFADYKVTTPEGLKELREKWDKTK